MEAPIPRHDATHFQLPVEAVKVFLDRASDIMIRNTGIVEEDWVWFYKYLEHMRQTAVPAPPLPQHMEVRSGPITKQ